MLRSAARLSSLALAAAFTLGASAQQATYTYSSAHRQAEQAIPQTVATPKATDAKLQAKLSAARTGTSLVVADFDADGYPDLITGYTTSAGGVLLLQRGAKAAQVPGPAEWAIKAAGQLVSPYKEKAEAIDLPVSPDLLLSGDISGHGSIDLATAAKGDSSVYVLQSHGDGTFSAPIGVPLAGSISSLALWRGPAGTYLLVAGVCGTSGCGLQFIDNTGTTQAFVRTPAAPTYLETGRINNGTVDDLAIVSNARPMVLDGDSALGKSPTIEKLPTTGDAALALGRYVMDSRSMLQLAVLGTDATLRIFTRTGVIDAAPTRLAPHKGALSQKEIAARGPVTLVKMTGTAWQEVETVPNVGSGGATMMLRAHLLGSGLDDLAVISGTQYTTVAHRLSKANGRIVTTPVVVADSTAAPVMAAMPARVAADARHGIVLLSSGPRPLVVSQPPMNKTYTVNTALDGNDSLTTTGRCTTSINCSLRDAVNLANVDEPTTVKNGTVDVINVPVGTYQLNVDNPTKGTTTPTKYDMLGSVNYHLELDGPAVINGAGTQTIIYANNVDQALTVNGGAYNATINSDGSDTYVPFIMDAFVSGMIIEDSTNTNNFNQNVNCQDNEYCNVYGGAVLWFSEGSTSSNFVMSNVYVTNSTNANNSELTWGGGGLSAYIDLGSATSNVSGPLDIENCTFLNNVDREGPGGGAIYVQNHMPVVINNSIFQTNSSKVSGGGALSLQPLDAYTVSQITNSTFTSNSGVSTGGAIYDESSLTMTGSTFTGNAGQQFGGALYKALQGQGEPASNITSNTFISNSLTGTDSQVTHTQDGGAVCVDGSPYAASLFTFNYNRVHGNTVTVSGAATGLAVGCMTAGTTSNYANVNANNNWWGCNGLATGTGCDTAHVGNASASETTFTLANYTSLILNMSSSSYAYGTSVVATASLGQNNASSPTVYTAAQDAAYLATPINTFTLTQTSTPTYSPSATAFSSTAAVGTSYAAATATGTANSSSGATGTATLTVDGTTVTKTYTVTGPPDLTINAVAAQSVKAGSTGNTYPLTVANIGGGPTTGTITLTDTLPSGFTATAISGTNWTCAALPALSCTYTFPVNASASAPTVTITYTATSTAGSYSDSATVGGGGEVTTNNDSVSVSTVVEGAPTIAEAFSPTTVATGANSTVTFTLGNPSANPASLTGVGFTDALPTNLVVSTPNGYSTTCTSGSVTATAGSTSITFSNATIASGATCTVTVNVVSNTAGSYPNTTGAVTSTNGSTGSTATATLTVGITPTKLVYTSFPATPIARGGNSGDFNVALEDANGNVNTADQSSQILLRVTATGYLQSYSAPVRNGVGIFGLSTINIPNAGTYTYTVTSGSLTSATASEIVNPDATTTAVSVSATTGTVGGSTTVSATVADSTNSSTPTTTGTITFFNTVNGSTTTIGTANVGTGGVASIAYPESYGGANSITATYTPADGNTNTSTDATGKTITVAKASPTQTSEIVDQTVQRNVSTVYTIIFTYPGKVPPSGAITVTLNGATLSVTPTCVYKTGVAPHSNCSFTYTTALAAGSYTFIYSQAADNNYNTFTGSSIITVTN